MPLATYGHSLQRRCRIDTTLNAMRAGCTHSQDHKRLQGIWPSCRHHGTRAAVPKGRGEVSKELKLEQPIPKSCTLVVGSPFDAAIHDAFGKLHGRSAYQTYGPT